MTLILDLITTISYFKSYFNNQNTFPANMLSCEFLVPSTEQNENTALSEQVCTNIWGCIQFMREIHSNTAGPYNNKQGV